MIMKEKINKFLFKGYHIIFCIWLEVAFILITVITGLTEGEWRRMIFGVLVYLPWLLLFIREYKFHKMQIQMYCLTALKDLIRSIAGDFAYELKRYKERYGDLPPEEELKPEESEKQNSTKQKQE